MCHVKKQHFKVHFWIGVLYSIYCSNDMYPKLFLKNRSTLLWMWLQEWTHLVGCVVGHAGVVTLLPPPPVLDHHLHVTHCYKGFGGFRHQLNFLRVQGEKSLNEWHCLFNMSCLALLDQSEKQQKYITPYCTLFLRRSCPPILINDLNGL